jgi:hypothetical protein
LDFPQTLTVSFNEAIPVFTRQHGILGHMFGGWSVAATYILQSGQTVTPEQIFLSSSTSPYNTLDNSFNAAFNSGFETARPFAGNPSAPATAIGIYAVDACNAYGNALSCAAAPNSLVDFTQLNASNGATTAAVQANQVRFITNTNEAQILNGTPYGNAGRNILRDAKTNLANFEVAKTVNWGERARIIWHMSMVNALNHPNFNTTDPFLEDAGLVQEGTGFDNPTVQNGGNRAIRFGLKVTF